MTETQWSTCPDSRKMFKVFGGGFGKMRNDPRLRRFAVECCRRVRHLITDDVFRAAADAGEAFADDPRNRKPTIPVMSKAAIDGVRHLSRCVGTTDRHQLHAAKAAIATCGSTAWGAGFNAMREAAQALNQAKADSCDPAELKYQADLLRCIFGSLLFHPKSINPVWLSWNGGTVLSLAQSICETRSFGTLPVLADALEDAGCTDADTLSHLRGPGPHVPGCCSVELLFGKS